MGGEEWEKTDRHRGKRRNGKESRKVCRQAAISVKPVSRSPCWGADQSVSQGGRHPPLVQASSGVLRAAEDKGVSGEQKERWHLASLRE